MHEGMAGSKEILSPSDNSAKSQVNWPAAVAMSAAADCTLRLWDPGLSPRM